MKNWIETGQPFAKLVTYGSQIVGDKKEAGGEQVSSSVQLANFLKVHFPGKLNYPKTLEQLLKDYQFASQCKPVKKGVLLEIISELKFRSYMGDIEAFKFYLQCAKSSNQDDKQIAAKLRKSGWPIPDKFGTPDGQAGACVWKPSNLRIARGGEEAAPVKKITKAPVEPKRGKGKQ